MNEYSISRQGSTVSPATDEVWSRLAPSVLHSISQCDARRLEIERDRVAIDIREQVTNPLYSVRNRFSFWEHLVRRMESGWQLPGQYLISDYVNDLDSRYGLQIAIGALAEDAQMQLSTLLAALDTRFVDASVPDDASELRPWMTPSSGEEPHGFLLRKPRSYPW